MAYYRRKNKIMPQFGQHILEKIKGKGIFYCVRRACYEIFSLLIVIFSYPFCRVMNVKFVPVYVRGIGHLCIEPDCYIKEVILGLRPKYNSIILAPPNKVANAHLLNYWKQHIKIITSPLLCFFLEPLSRNRLTRDDTFGYAFSYKSYAPKIQKKYFGRPPLLSLTEFDYKRGWACLQDLGMPEDAWFVCVHCREGGYLDNVNQTNSGLGIHSGKLRPWEDNYKANANQTNRNADINNYLLAMEAIVERGGWVIRMGDQTMKPIPKSDHIVDYAHLDIKTDWMDVFLSSSCKFFLGSSSGLFLLADIFGVPSGVVNLSAMATVLPYGTNDIGIPKLIWSLEEERYLSFKEVFSSPIGSFRSDSSYTKAMVWPEENSPEDIKDVAMEMLEKVEGRVLYTDEDERLQKSFKSLLTPDHGASYGAISRVGRDFLRKHKDLLV